MSVILSVCLSVCLSVPGSLARVASPQTSVPSPFLFPPELSWWAGITCRVYGLLYQYTQKQSPVTIGPASVVPLLISILYKHRTCTVTVVVVHSTLLVSTLVAFASQYSPTLQYHLFCAVLVLQEYMACSITIRRNIRRNSLWLQLRWLLLSHYS